jgi:hypothetical protein
MDRWSGGWIDRQEDGKTFRRMDWTGSQEDGHSFRRITDNQDNGQTVRRMDIHSGG